MSTLFLVLAYIVAGIFGFTGGGVVIIALFNLLDRDLRWRRNHIAWKVFTGQSGKGDVFIIKDKVLAAKFWDVLGGKMFFTRGPGKGKHKQKTVVEYTMGDSDKAWAEQEGGKP